MKERKGTPSFGRSLGPCISEIIRVSSRTVMTPRSSRTSPTYPRAFKNRKYDPLVIAKLRHEKGLSLGDIGKLTGASAKYIGEILAKLDAVMQSPGLHVRYQAEKPRLLSGLEAQAMASLTDPDEWKRASLRDRAVTYGIISDKLRLETGRSTQNIGVLAQLTIAADAKLFAGDKASSCDAESTSDKSTNVSST